MEELELVRWLRVLGSEQVQGRPELVVVVVVFGPVELGRIRTRLRDMGS